MKVTILDLLPGEEEEIIVKCNQLSEDMMRLLARFKQGNDKLTVYQNGTIHRIEPGQIYYFESVDQKEVYEVKSKLYELEEELNAASFMRAAKSTILNLDKIKSLSPAFGGRFEALLKNGEKVIISRQYVALLKERLGI